MLTLNKQTQKFTYQIPECHNKLNQYGKFALQTKQQTYRSIHHRHILGQSATKIKTSPSSTEQALSKLLLSRNNKSNQKILNPQLRKSIMKLSQIGLDKPTQVKHIKYESLGKMPHIHNDYHSRATNLGYSRSETGGIFPK